MEKTPISMRKHIALVGKTNSGKSTLFNRLLGSEISIVSDVKGTTTDPVIKAMELIPYGPVALIDTAGLGDDTILGKKRENKTESVLTRADLIVHIIDVSDKDAIELKSNKPVVKVYTKCEIADEDKIRELKQANPDSIFVSEHGRNGLDKLKEKLVEILSGLEKDSETFIGDILAAGSVVVMVVPIDGAAPKGRLILPQVQLLRDCLDHDIKAYVTKDTTLKSALSDLAHVDLVVTDSQIFKYVSDIVPTEIPLTSFSMLMARQKGNFNKYIEGAEYLSKLKYGSKILVMEGCTHNATHEDIGKVKIPALIEKKLGVKCEYDFVSGYDFPKDLEEYDLVLSCGMCMINKQEVLSRIDILDNKKIPVVNYGVALAYLNGILDRAKEIFCK